MRLIDFDKYFDEHLNVGFSPITAEMLKQEYYEVYGVDAVPTDFIEHVMNWLKEKNDKESEIGVVALKVLLKTWGEWRKENESNIGD